MDKIEVFQDLEIQGSAENRRPLTEALINAARGSWSVDLERAAATKQSLGISEDVVLFRRERTNDYPDVGITLWQKGSGYYVPNIVPLEQGHLSYSQYNAALADFRREIVEPVIAKFGFQIVESPAQQGLEDWLEDEAAVKLRRFSHLANKSTGAGHPLDERRWFDFIVSVHCSDKHLGPDLLARWLQEAEHWGEREAHKLAGEYEHSLSLLKFYDHFRAQTWTSEQ